MATTPNRGYQLPAASSKLKDDVLRLIAALGAIDTDVAGLLTALAGKADLGHGHAMAEITGLVAALGNKLDVGYHDALANLTDVDVAGVASGMALLRQASKWIPVALQINNIAGLETALNGKATPADITAAINSLVAAAPGALDTLNELATALGNDPNFASTITTALAGKQPLDSDLTAIAALTTTAFGRALLTAADAAALRTAANAASADAAIRDDIDQSAQSKASGLKVNILKNTLQAWELIEDVTLTSVASYVRSNLAEYSELRFEGFVQCAANSYMMIQLSSDNAATFVTSGYFRAFVHSVGGAAPAASASGGNSGIYTYGEGNSAVGETMDYWLYEFNKTTRKRYKTGINYKADLTGQTVLTWGAGELNVPQTMNALRVVPVSGLIAAAKFKLYGKRG